MKIRNKDIAEQLGISVTAVSLALNNKPGVSDETRAKVLQLFNQHHGETMQTISDMASIQPKTILLSVHKRTGKIIDDKPFFSDLIEVIQQEAMKNHYVMTIAHYLPGQDIRKYIQYLRSTTAEGIFILGTEINPSDLSFYQELDIPLVLIDASFPLANINSVTIDNETSILRALGYAVSLGHKNIGYLKSSYRINNFDRRYDGFMKGIRTYHLEEYSHPVISLPCDLQEAYEEMKKYLHKNAGTLNMPTLFLADLDYIAIGAMQALKEAGYRIPDDVSLIGYDDLDICMATDPNLTSVKVNQAAIGKQAFSKLMEEIRQTSFYTTTTEISSELVLRDSVASPSGDDENSI